MAPARRRAASRRCAARATARARSCTRRASSWCRRRVHTAEARARRSKIRADCRGRGAKAETSTLSVTVPSGVDDGQTLRLAGKGETAAGGATGHLYVVLHVQGDERFRRDGEDVLTEIPVSFVKAALGGEVEIYTLD